MKLFLFLGSRRGLAVLKKLIEVQAEIRGILCLIEDAHEEQCHQHITTLAQENNIPIFYTDKVKPADYAEVLKAINPEIVFVIGWRYLIPTKAHTIPAKGMLIIHDSLLPKYRGFAPMNWAIINGEDKTGVTLFYISEGVDSGPTVDQLSTTISLIDTAKTVDEKIIKLYEEIIVKNLPTLANGTANRQVQDENQATYSCKRTPEDGEINWQASALQIYNLIRGLTHPFPGAYTTLRGRKIYIWAAGLPQQKQVYAGNIPGRIIGKKDHKIEVLTGDGVLQLTQLQFSDEEKKFAKDIQISVKETFGKKIFCPQAEPV